MRKQLKYFPLVLAMALLMASTVGAEHPKAEAAEAKSDHPQKTAEPFAEFVTPSDSLPHLRYFADSKTTLNDRCPVRLVRLNPKMGSSYVNQQPVGFC